MTGQDPKSPRPRALEGQGSAALRDITCALTTLAADFFALYLKTKNFHWHVSGPHFRDYHLLLDEQADQILASVDPLAERVRKLGGTTIRSIGHIAKLQRVRDNDAEFINARQMLIELLEDNRCLAIALGEAHDVCEVHSDLATTSLIETFIDEAQRRGWFLLECSRGPEPRSPRPIRSGAGVARRRGSARHTG